jgi:avidin family protein
MDTIEQARERWLGVWQNAKGSVMRIQNCKVLQATSSEKSEHFSVEGSYQTAKGRVPFAVKCPLCGFVTNDQIAFCVSFRLKDAAGEVHSLTSWAGQILPEPDNSSKQRLSTLWNLVPDLEEGEVEERLGWVVAWSGADKFMKISKDPDHEVVETKIAATG